MKEKKGLMYFITTIIIFLAINITAFVIPFNRTATYWIGYGFTMVAILVSFAVSFYAFRGDLKSKFYGFPLVYLAWGYLALQTILGLLFMALSMLPYQVSLIISVLLLGAYLIGMMATDITQEYAESVEKKVKEKTFFVKYLQLDIAEILSGVTNEGVASAIRELADDIKYSDPMSAEQLSDIEARISEKMSVLRDSVNEDNNEEAISQALSIRKLIAQRNQRCKLLK